MPAFVGRAPELEALRRGLAAARAGHGTSVLVTGEAGIGKTRLVCELQAEARAAGFAVLLGRAIDFAGTELPYQPFAEALGELRRPADSQLRVFQHALTLLDRRSARQPALLVLEDLHWADTSSLDLHVFLAHHLRERHVLVLATARPDEPASAGRVRRLADGVRRSDGLVLELGPLAREELAALLATHPRAPEPARCEAIAARAEGNPFFAEELLAVAEKELPARLRDVLLQRVSRLDRPAQDVLRLAAAAGREVGYPRLRDAGALSEPALREALRQAHEHGVLVADPATGRFRFRHALLAEAVYATILPGEREEVHARLAGALARSGAEPAELAPHWAAAGRSAEALAASVEAARRAEAVFGLAEALAHLERALVLWEAVPDAPERARLDLAELSSWAAELASQLGAGRRALALGRRAVALLGTDDPRRAALLHVRLAEYLYELGRDEEALAALARAVELAPEQPPTPERAYALGSLAGGLMVAWRHAESLPLAEEALALARELGAPQAIVRALTVVGCDLVHLGRGEAGIACLRQALELAEQAGDRVGLERAYVNATDKLTILGRPGEAARLARAGLAAMRRIGTESPLLVSNHVEALVQTGDWDEADAVSAASLRDPDASFRYMLLVSRADLETGRGDFAAAGAHLRAATPTLRREYGLGRFDISFAELALWERRWTDARAAVQQGLSAARPGDAAPIRLQLCAQGLRAEAELAALARARRRASDAADVLARAGALHALAGEAAGAASAVTPAAAGWLRMADGEHGRARGEADPAPWADAAATWERLGRAPLAAYCRWREAEALVAAGASRAAAGRPLAAAHGVAARIGAAPLRREVELLAERARLDVAPPVPSAPGEPAPSLGLTPREAEVLALVSRGYTNREIAEALVISTRTAAVHVSHILGKLDAPNRVEAAAIAHRLQPPA